ncbi:DNA repair protein XRCC3-like [Sycon ciliatum]|uniref:DNA repair protein XRCC3-like n=1 Tax=Sycon ciliatum TaxID=27933 RepID=UPI0031F6D1FD
MSRFSYLELDESILTKLDNCSIPDFSPESLVTHTYNSLVHRSDLSPEEARLVLRTAAEKCCQLAPVSALSILQGDSPQWLGSLQYVSTGCRSLDTFLRGGIPFRGLFEICGESRSGKTQFCLQLCLNVQLWLEGSDDHRRAALYISTEDVFPHKRLAQLARYFSREHGRRQWMDGIYVEHALSHDDLDKVVSHRLPALIAGRRVRLVILDSIAAVARAEFGLGDESDRAEYLTNIGLQLRQFSVEHAVAVVIVNQVSAVIDGSIGDDEDDVQPALGLTWSDMVATRVLLSRDEPVTEEADEHAAAASAPEVPRQLQVIFSPYLPQNSIHFVVQETGIQDFNKG